MTVAPSDIPRTLKLTGSYPAGFTITLQSTPGTTVYLERTSNLNAPVAWTPVTSTPGTGAAVSLLNTSLDLHQRFYHVRVQ